MSRRPVLALVALLLAAAPAAAWFTLGHSMIARAAVAALPDRMPAFFRQGEGTIGHLAVDPDLMKPSAMPALRAAESPEHYLDVELLGGRDLPPNRYDYLRLLREIEVDPATVGTLPYAVVELTDRLTVAFAEFRRSPYDPHVQTKALVYAGLLAHYAGDLSQPLHTTVHHDGRALPDGSSPHTGVHQRIDGLIERVPFDPAAVPVSAAAFADPWSATLARFAESHAQVEAAYELDEVLAGGESAALADPNVVAFTEARFGEAASFLASLYLTAWERSAAVVLPSWLGEGLAREGDRSAPAAKAAGPPD